MSRDDLRAKAKAVSVAEDEVRSAAETPHEAIERQHALDIAEIEWHHVASPHVVLGLLDEIERLRVRLVVAIGSGREIDDAWETVACRPPPEAWDRIVNARETLDAYARDLADERRSATPLEGDPK